MKKVTLILMVSLLCILTGNLMAQTTVVVDQTGTDFQNFWYVGTWGKQITLDGNGKVHIAYCKTWAKADGDTGYQVMYANVTDNKILEIPSQEPDDPIQPGIVYIGGGQNSTPIYLYYGVGSRMYAYGPAMHLQAMAKVSADGNSIEPLGMQTDKNYYHDPHYANPIAMEVSSDGIVHCLLSNPSGWELSYWNFDGTNFSEITAMLSVYPDEGVPGKEVPDRFRRKATKGADLAVNSDGSEVTIASLHPKCNIYLHKGTFGGEIWADNFFTGLDDGSVVALFDTTGTETGTNIPNNDPKPYTEIQVVYDAMDKLHVVYDATYQDVYVDTANLCAPGVVDSWWNTYGSWAGDTVAVFYDGSEHPKPQLRYWNDGMAIMVTTATAHTLLAECTYPLAGDMYKWYTYGVVDTLTGEIGVTYAGSWGDYLNDGPIGNIELIVNKDQQEGEPMLVCLWEEMQGEVLELVDAEESFSNPYYAYRQDIKVSVSNDGSSWSMPDNITDTPDKDETAVSAYNDVIDNKIHIMYYEDTYAGRDRIMVYCDDFEDKFVLYTGHQGGSVPIRKETEEQVNVVYREVSLGVPPYVVPTDTLIKIARAANPPVIDGLLDVMWYNAGENRDFIVIPADDEDETVDDWFDMGLSFRALYDADNLYVFMSVKDETLVRDSGNDWWQDDSFELYIDGDNSKGQTYDGVNDQGFHWSYNEATILDPDPLGWETMAAVRTAYGIDLEVAIPIEKLGITPVAGHKIGIEMQWNEDDDGGLRGFKVQHFSDVDEAWQNPSYMGTAELEARTVHSELAVYQTDTAPTIDGEMDDMWFGFPLITSNNYPEVSSGVTNLAKGWQDASYTFRTAWDANNLYLFIVVKDETLVRDSGTEFYNDDAVELYIDSDNSKGASYDGVNDWGFHWRCDETTVFDPTLASGNGIVTDFSPIQQGAVFTEDGLTLELALPMDFLKLNPAVGTLFGFELDYDDDDDGGARDTKVKYFTKMDDSWQYPNTLGTAQLVGAPGTGVADAATVVMDYRLDQNYPNPFNPTTTIHYSLKEPNLVNLTVFNMLGQKVKTLVDARQPAGLHVTQWDGKDQFGNTVAGGVYFYQIKSGKFVSIKKMVLVK
jgi:hypothetical protein